ncbi:MAG: hypothetical protein R2708_27550 [Vicinamibacterales bacterium]
MLRIDSDAVGGRARQPCGNPASSNRSADCCSAAPAQLEFSTARDTSRELVARRWPVVARHRRSVVVVLHDVTDLKRADEVRRDFVANVSHLARRSPPFAATPRHWSTTPTTPTPGAASSRSSSATPAG